MFAETEAVAALETNIWSMMAQFGRVDPGRLIETPTRLVLETDVVKPPYNTVLRFYDEGDRSIDAQVHELVARFERRSCTPAWLVHPTTPSGVRVATTERGRGKGLASLLANVALHATADAGFRASVLHSTPMAHSMYQRLGYRDVATRGRQRVPS